MTIAFRFCMHGRPGLTVNLISSDQSSVYVSLLDTNVLYQWKMEVVFTKF